ncbi:flagellar protein FliT [Vibrio sp. S4M6]|uniref:flagellar protein FliT n=1 Tax=Vibrio sinus TaxID=2946865 RepID=UPI00202A2C60|nr:flagellar protein FliT [Vibrio sinus]MCL9782550.1 flagellar protein FliT [Vibrio sinus]
MKSELEQICDLNNKIRQCITESEINTEELTQFVDIREQILHTVISGIKADPSCVDKEEWQSVILETQLVVELMQTKTAELGQALKKYRHGSKSVQQYKKFL